MSPVEPGMGVMNDIGSRAAATHSVAMALLGCMGCAMSPSAYDSLANTVRERNLDRREAAIEGLRAEGYELVEDIGLLALLDDVGTDRCRQAMVERYAGPADEAGSADGTEPTTLTVRIVRPSSRGESELELELEVAVDEACGFFLGQGGRLSGLDPAGGTIDLTRFDRPIARAPTGELVWIKWVVEVISERTVMVEQSCNEMPSLGPEPFGQRPDPVAVMRSPAPTREVALEVQREDLDYECTDVVE